jgi:uncharacterized protein (DUF2141 family)
MKFLQKLFYASWLLGLMAATSDDALRENQLAAATQVICGKIPGTNTDLKWTHDEFLGNVGGKPVYTIIHQNRIYIRWDGNPDQSRKNQAFENTAILLHMDNNKFPNNTDGNRIVNTCINAIDPSTMGNNYLGTQQGNIIPCNNKPIKDGMKLGTYVGGDGVRTFQYAIIKDGLLRVNFHRETNNYNREDISMGLMLATFNGENGSSIDPNMGFSLSYNEVLSCFWNELPKYPDSVIDPEPNCPGGPTVGTVSNISQTGLRFSYSGSGIPNIDWRIKSGGTVVRSGKTGTLSSTNVDISFGSIAAGNYTLEIEGGDCASSVSATNFSVAQANCAGGPTISSIKNVSPTALTVDFNGSGVPNLTWRIKQNGSTVRNGKTGNLGSNSASISFNSLGAGTYSLEIEGGDCSSAVSASNFTVVPGSCPGGPTLGMIANVSATGLRFQFDGNGVPNITWRIKSGATVVRSGKTPGLTSSLVDISYDAIGGGSYTLEIEGGDCVSTVSSKSFTFGQANCPGGPTISSIKNVSATGLTVDFSGSGVSTLTWRIKSGANVLASGKTGSLGSNSASISFASLAAGTYSLEIEGGDCTSSVSASNFTVATPNCGSGPTITSVKNVSATGLTVDFNGSGVSVLSWRVKSAGNVVASGRTGTLTSNSASFTFNSLGAGNYTVEIEGGNCVSSVSSANFSVVAGTCPDGPILLNVTNISASGLRFQFHGNGIPNITWRVKSGGAVVRSGKTPQLTSALVDISFATIGSGSYTLEIEGGDCSSLVSSKDFSIGQANCPGGPSITSVKNVSATGLTVDFNGSGVSTLTWRIKAGGAVVASGKTGTLTSNSATISFNSLATGSYALEIEGGDCTSSVSTSNFNIATPNCASGPTISTIKNVSATGLTVDFNGSGVSTLTWRVKQGSTTLASGKTGNLSSNSASFTFASLAAGTYTLEIEGGDCVSSVSTSNFSVSATACPGGPTLGLISNVSATGLRFQFDGIGVSNITWRIKSGANVVRSGATGTLTSAQVDITYASIGDGSYTFEIEGGDCVSSVSSKAFTFGQAGCPAGPKITNIKNISATGLTVDFSGSGVSMLTWRIKLGGILVASGKTGNLASNSAAITFASLAAGTYALEIEGGDCKSAVHAWLFPVKTANCESGPRITNIKNISSSGLTVDFSGSGVSTLTWRIKLGGVLVASGKTGNLVSNTASIMYPSLPAGTYALEIEGGDCTSSVHAWLFPIKATNNCPGGPTISSIKNVSATGLTVDFNGSGVSTLTWRIKSGGNIVASGKTGSLGSNTASVSFASLAAGTYSLEIEGGDCTSSVSASNFTVTSTDNRAACQFGPLLKAIVDPKATELTFNFHGENVASIDWKIMQGASTLRSARVELTSDHPTISYAALAAGSYTLAIEGGSCKSAVQTQTFTVGQLPIRVARLSGESDTEVVKSKAFNGSEEAVSEVVVSPNPVSDIVNVEFYAKSAGKGKVETYNISGVKVNSFEPAIQAGKNKISLNAAGFNDGHYFIKVSHGDQVMKVRFFKSK